MEGLMFGEMLTSKNLDWEKVRKEMCITEPRYFEGKPLGFCVEWCLGSMVIRYGFQTLYIHAERQKEFIKKTDGK